MISYWLMPVRLNAWKRWEIFKFQKPPAFDVHTHPNLTVSLRWEYSRNDLNLNNTLCTVVGTIWCDRHAGTVTAARLRTNLTHLKKKLKKNVSVCETNWKIKEQWGGFVASEYWILPPTSLRWPQKMQKALSIASVRFCPFWATVETLQAPWKRTRSLCWHEGLILR